jgi:hypothetical protein
VRTQKPVGPILQQGSPIKEAFLDGAQQLLLTYRPTGAFGAWRRPAGTTDVWQVAGLGRR